MLDDPFQNQLGPYGDSTTSQQAALSNFPRSGSQRHRVLWAYIRAGSKGCTRDELSASLHLPDSSIDPRVWELKNSGWIKPNGKQRITRAQSQAEVLILTPEALHWLLDPANSHIFDE